MDIVIILSNTIFFSLLAAIAYGMTGGREKLSFFKSSKHQELKYLPPALFKKYDNILHRRNSYYQKLSFRGKNRFVERLIEFNANKSYQGRLGLEITFEMEVMVGASAIQLTFGLDNYLLNHIKDIRLYPESFYVPKHRITGQLPARPGEEEYVKIRGKTSMRGMIGLSWKDFLKGYDVPDDNYNLGLHEMAHALKLSLNEGYDFDDKFSFYLDNWLEIGSKEFRQMGEGSDSFLRAYGGTNMHEFFSVCVEHFFESPHEFKKRLPDLYNHLCFLLNQNPANHESDYAVTQAYIEMVNKNPARIPIPEKVRQHYKYHSWHWTLTIIILGIFPGFISFMFLNTITELPANRLLLITALTVFITTFIQYHYLKSNGVLAWRGFAAYNFLGVIPIVLAIYLFTNLLIPVDTYTEEYPISKIVFIDGEILVHLENNKYKTYKDYRTMPISYEQVVFLARPQSLKIRFRKGVLGLRTYQGNEFAQFRTPELISE